LTNIKLLAHNNKQQTTVCDYFMMTGFSERQQM